MSTVTRWWWVRHAPVTTDGGKIYGQTDMPADVSNEAPFQALARALPTDGLLVTSHLRRTHQTAAAIGAAGLTLGDPLVMHGLAEQHFGDWQGRDRTEVWAEFGADHGFWIAPAHHAPPGGESFAELMDRVVAVIEDLTRLHAGRDIVAVTHGGTIRAAIGHAMGLPPDRALGFVVDNCSLTRLDYHDAGEGNAAWRIVSLNEGLGAR